MELVTFPRVIKIRHLMRSDQLNELLNTLVFM